MNSTEEQTLEQIENILCAMIPDHSGESEVSLSAGISLVQALLASQKQEGIEQGKAEERERIVEEYGDFRKIETPKMFQRVLYSKALRFFLAPHSKHKKGDDESTY